MATPKGYKVDTKRSIVIGTRQDIEAPALEHAYREDTPSPNDPVEATIYRNVLPTELGYSSAFGLIPIGQIPTWTTDYQFTVGDNLQEAFKAAPKQEVLWLETGSLHRVGITLGEDGIWFIAPGLTLEESIQVNLDLTSYVSNWYNIIPIEFEVGVRYLWTTCVIDGVVYAYRQGDPSLYVIGDFAGRIPEGLGETVWENEGLQVRISRATPTFLNMEGQMGIFRADNRLGFWDSDNAVAWSSAINKLDFKPDVTTFAGVTKYSEVAGVITKVVEHGKGFIIYASRSIVHCQSMHNSPEKWSGQAITNTAGVQYDTQIAVGKPSTTHYVWVDNSMAIISDGQISFSLPELADRVRENFYLVRLSVPCSRYLYISFGQEWDGGAYDRRAKVIFDGLGRPFYKAPGYSYEGYTPSPEFWQQLIGGGLIDWPFPEFEEEWYEPEEPEMELPPIREQSPIMPFFKGHKYIKPINSVDLLDWTAGAPDITKPMTPLVSFKYDDLSAFRIDPVRVFIDPSNPNAGTTERETEVSEYLFVGQFTPFMVASDWDMTDITQIGTRYIDKAGDEFYDLIRESAKDFWEDYQSIQLRFKDQERLHEFSTKFWDEDSITAMWQPDKGWGIETPPSDVCSIVEPVDITQAFSKISTADLTAMNSKDPVQLSALSDKYKGLYVEFIRAIRNKRDTDLKSIATRFPETSKRILAAIRIKDYDSLIPLAEKYKNDSDSIDHALEYDDLESLDTALDRQYDLEEAILEAIYAGDLTSLPTVEITELGVATGILPIDNQIKTIWDGCKMRMLVKMDRQVAYAVRHMFGESVYIDSTHCREFGTPPDPDAPTYSYFMQDGPAMLPGSVNLRQTYEWIPESLIGKTEEEIDFLLNDDESPLWIPIFDAELSGWGFERRVGGSKSYIKTHNVSPFTPCQPSLAKTVLGFPPSPDVDEPYPPPFFLQYPQNTTQPPPETLPMPWEGEKQPGAIVPDTEYFYPDIGAVRANFQKGTKHPYYPTYEWALVYDNLLKKWGSLNTAHQLIFSSYPVNSNSQVLRETDGEGTALSAGIIPVFRTPSPLEWEDTYAWENIKEQYYYYYNGGLTTTHLTPVGLAADGDDGLIRYSKLGAQRAGHTLFTGISVKLSSTYRRSYKCSVELGTSLSNLGFDGSPDLWEYGGLDADPLTWIHRWTSRYTGHFLDLEAPCRLTGRWGTVTIRGNFNLTGLALYGKPVGRMRYFSETKMY